MLVVFVGVGVGLEVGFRVVEVVLGLADDAEPLDDEVGLELPDVCEPPPQPPRVSSSAPTAIEITSGGNVFVTTRVGAISLVCPSW